MKETVYIETTIVSYLTARRSKQIGLAGDQIATHDWWNTQRNRFELVTSQMTIVEASAGFRAPFIATPMEMFDEEYYERRNQPD
jgi:hypothetical protein